jgi:polysaccharide pyruvyl transferase WcaK-like protein
MSKKIQLFWWSERKLMGKLKENYGDLLGKYLVEKISGKKVVWVQPKKQWLKMFFRPVYVTIGSVLAQVNSKCIVWGSGIINRDQHVDHATFLAVRGPKTRDRLLDLGYKVPAVYGDPAILLPKYYNPAITKKYTYGIIPHYSDYSAVKEQYKNWKEVQIIDLMTNDIEDTTNQILECERIVSSSLHGLIIAHSYHIPAIWVKFSDKLFGDDIKFEDYFESVKLPFISKAQITTNLELADLDKLFDTEISLPNVAIIKELQEKLLDSCPFV